MFTRKTLLSLIIVIIVLLAACGIPATSSSTPTSVPALTPSSTITSTPTYTILNEGVEVQTAHCRVINNGFDVGYALAWANICEVSYEGYRKIYGIDVLALNNLRDIEVRLFRDERGEPSLDAHGGKITFRGNDAHLSPPADGGANNIYGICHEMGHLVFPIADPYYFEAWADYAAAYRLIPYIWERLGAEAWPQPYNYLVNDGPADIQQRIENGADGTDMVGDHYWAVAVLISVDEAYGPQVIGQAILQTEAPMKLNNFEEALIRVTGDQTVRKLFAIEP